MSINLISPNMRF